MHDIKKDGNIMHDTNTTINIDNEGGDMWLYNCVLDFYTKGSSPFTRKKKKQNKKG